MQFKFLHTADIHLGYQQYGLSERYDDFTEAFRWIVDTALDERVDFLLIAGDLFEKRTLDPRTLLIAVTEFERLKAAGIPVVAIEGNHERTYGESLSWMEYLSQSDLLYLLDCSRHDQGGRRSRGTTRSAPAATWTLQVPGFTALGIRALRPAGL